MPVHLDIYNNHFVCFCSDNVPGVWYCEVFMPRSGFAHESSTCLSETHSILFPDSSCVGELFHPRVHGLSVPELLHCTLMLLHCRYDQELCSSQISVLDVFFCPYGVCEWNPCDDLQCAGSKKVLSRPVGR